ncbi:hypothetical protein CS022_24370 [Veronia nyctiphanis]|uniref:Chondroitin AC lyase n=1 Tax=Veronia nyctiphanis TaxID=1278244 RepID=A0A4Q0YBB5_9GAMM|nr:hypothetical protein CS022_24370 [Veronia nyctiphanis]
MLYKKYLIFITVILTFTSRNSIADDVSTLKDRVTREYAQSYSEDTLIISANKYKEKIEQNGRWPDINYSLLKSGDTHIREHLNRIKILSAAGFIFPQKGYSQAAVDALFFWYSINPKHENWWWNTIGRQLYLGPSALMLGNLLPSQLETQIIADLPSHPQMTGANRSDISKGVIYRGLLSDNAHRVNIGISGIKETVVITDSEGIQADYSFHQHGPQLYTGGYGEAFFNTAVFWAYQVRDLQWQFSPKQIDVLTNFYLEGMRWMNSHGTLDYNVIGRGISRLRGIHSSGTKKQSDYIATLSPDKAEAAHAFRDHVTGGNSGLIGFKNFWRSDYASKIGQNHFIGIRMNSNRTEPNESGNGENLLGNWLGFGSMFIMRKGNEYHNIFPVWNWALIPGVTSPQLAQKPADWGAISAKTSFVGGVSNGRFGVAVMNMNAHQTKAKKAWFSFDDEMVALGAGITSTHNRYINTTINQTKLNGPVTVDGVEYKRGSRAIVDASWVHHDGVGYVFPAYWYGHMDNQTKHGNWNNISSSQPNKAVKEDVFMLRIGHSWKPSNRHYQYIIVPDKTAEEVQQYSQNTPIVVLENSTNIQSVTNEAINVTGVVFHRPGNLTLLDGSILSVNQPSVLVIDQSKSEPRITLSTPGRGTEVFVTFESEGSKKQARINTSSDQRWLGKEVEVNWGIEGSVFPVIKDTFVRNGRYKNQSFGKAGYLEVKADHPGYKRNSVLQFNLQGQKIDSSTTAKLRLYVRNLGLDSHRSIIVSRLAASDWSESSLTWHKVPRKENSGPRLTIERSDRNSWVEVDVSSLIHKEGLVSLLLENPGHARSQSYVSFSSREGKYAPQLVLYRSVKSDKDAYVRDGKYVTQSFGNAHYLAVKADHGGYNRKSIISFDLSEKGVDLNTSAILKLYVNSVGKGEKTLTVSRLSDSEWSESAISWTSLPTNEAATKKNLVVSSRDLHQWVEVDVSEFIHDGKVSLLVENLTRPQSESYVSFSSRETSRGPSLILSD